MSPPLHSVPSQSIAANPGIASDINTATKKLHTELNRRIIERLPLGLPPHTSSPSRYAIGLEQFACIYFAFEDAFDTVARNTASEISFQDDVDKERQHRQDVKEWLGKLLPPGLTRSSRLRVDLAHLRKRTNAVVDHKLGKAEETWSARLSSCHARPHVLVAYAWIMYMAIFSGGRWIRSQLASVDPAFWSGKSLESGLTVESKKAGQVQPGFAFLGFDDDEDGEALKTAFKVQLTQADTLLTPVERQEVIEESKRLFTFCIDSIGDIDRAVLQHEASSPWVSIAIILLLVGLWHFFVR